uniref:Solute carrier family 3 member 2 N-terminal domain-containing protein n=1 Tax=Anopheles atroparvus TaxID=41427 RepID=A0A182IMS9_ANOAO
MTKAELNKYIDDPWWINLRYRCSAFCWFVCLLALAISLFIAADALQHDPCGLMAETNNDVNDTQTPSLATALEATDDGNCVPSTFNTGYLKRLCQPSISTDA